MGIFARIIGLLRAEAGEIVEKIDNPEALLNQAVRDKEQSLRDAKTALRDCICTERESKSKLNKFEESVIICEKWAEHHLKNDDEAKAKEFLEKSEKSQKKANWIRPIWEQQSSIIEGLRAEVKSMEEKLEEIKMEKDFLIAQSKTSDISKQLSESRAKIGPKEDIAELMGRIRERSTRAKYQAEAAQEVAEEFSEPKEPVTKPQISVDEKLAEMKFRIQNEERKPRKKA